MQDLDNKVLHAGKKLVAAQNCLEEAYNYLYKDHPSLAEKIKEVGKLNIVIIEELSK